MTPAWISVCRCLWLSFLVPKIFLGAAEFPEFANEFTTDAWTTENGLPQNSITAMAQTPDGYLWLGTFNGLLRFDGARFKVFDPVNTPALKSARVVELDVDKHGTLWITSEESYLARFAAGTFESMNGQFGLPPGRAVCKGANPDGEATVIVDGRYYRFHSEHFHPIAPSVEIAQARPDALRVRWPNRGWIRSHGAWHFATANEWRSNFSVTGKSVVFHEDATGTPWVSGLDRKLNLRTGAEVPFKPPIPSTADLTSAVEDSEGNLWIGTWIEGLFIITPSGETRRIALGGHTESIRGVMRDLEGNIWVGTDTAGLYRIKRKLFKTFGVKEGLRGEIIKAVFEDAHDRIWVLNEKGVDWILPDATVRAGWSGATDLWAGGVSPEGKVWIGNWAGNLWQFREGDFVRCSFDRFELARPIRVLEADGQGQMWLGTSGGLARLTDDRTESVPLPKELPVHDVRAICEDSTGRLYVGLYGGGLLRRAREGWERFGKEQGLADAHIYSLRADSNGVMWVGTAYGGLSRFQENRFFNFVPGKFPLPRTISSILPDGGDDLWLGSSDGIFRVRRSELHAAVNGAPISTVQHYDTSDGLGTRECAAGMSPTVWKSRAGGIWFATVRGVSVVSPQDLTRNVRPPAVVIEEVLVDEEFESDSFQAVRPGLHSPTPRAPAIITVPPGNRRVEIHYTGLSLTAPEKVRFRYRLDGLDEDWIEAGQRRAVHYQSLPPGSYRFRVTACNNDGIWNPTGTTLGLVVEPFFWQTLWFRALLVVGVGGLILGAYEMRIRRLQQARIAQELLSRRLIQSQEQERKRIAAELHDSLGQNLLIIKNRAIMGLNHSAPPQNAPQQLEEISRVASQTLDEVREISHNLRPYQLDRLGLTKALHALVTKVAHSTHLNIKTDIDPIDRLLPAEFEINLYRVVQESLNNLVKHSQAKSARLSIRRSKTKLWLTIEDDGRGFDSSEAHASRQDAGFGLSGTAERIRILRGRISYDSAPGRGTRVIIEIPLPETAPEN
ncbi:MAG: two-component regulator propeller domain-containing protein [Verrucomicrobiota bacterium]